MDAVQEHRDEMAFNHSIFSHFTATLCNVSGKEVRGKVTYRDIYDPFRVNVHKKIDQHTQEGKEKIQEAIKMFD